MDTIDVSGRDVLAGARAGVGASTFLPGVGGADSTVRHIVGTSNQAGTDAAKRRAKSVYRVLDFGDIGQAVAGQFADEALDALDGNPNVRYIEADGTVRAIAQTPPWGVDRADADIAHGTDSSQDGDGHPETGGDSGGDGGDGDDDPAGADIVIIDTGIDSDHPDLQANLGTDKAFVSCKGGPQDCRYAWDDDEGHGTHCAGIADAVDNDEGVVGVSTGATLHAVKVLGNSGSGSFSDVAAGIGCPADQGYDVVSVRLGASSGSQTTKDACQYAVDNGVLLAAAAGTRRALHRLRGLSRRVLDRERGERDRPGRHPRREARGELRARVRGRGRRRRQQRQHRHRDGDRGRGRLVIRFGRPVPDRRTDRRSAR
ncbi:MAG: S8 family serine peptidase [Haloferacaceae archaeon]